MHALVTGATGFIGSNLCNKLLKQGFKVTGLSRTKKSSESASYLRDFDPKRFQTINCDIVDNKGLVEIFEKLEPVDCIFHLAGQTYQKNSTDSRSYFQNNFIGTLNMLECCRIYNIKKFVFSSSVAVYGLSVGQSSPKYLPVDEKHFVNPYDFYDLSKYHAEELCKFYYKRFGIACIVLRYSRVYGPTMMKGFIFQAIRKALSNEPLEVFGDVSTDFVFIDDVVKANIATFEKTIPEFEIFNIGSGQEITLYWICSKIIELTHSSSQLKFHANNTKSKFSLDISKAKTILGYEPVRLEQGLIECIHYIKNSTK